MGQAHERAKKLLIESGVTEENGAFYHRGLEKMSDADAERLADDLEATLALAPDGLAAAKRLLAGSK